MNAVQYWPEPQKSRPATPVATTVQEMPRRALNRGSPSETAIGFKP